MTKRTPSNLTLAASVARTIMFSPRRWIGLFDVEAIRRRGPRRSFEAVDYTTLEWVDRFNTCCLLEPIGNMPPAEAEARYFAQTKVQPLAA